jgi:hypothetical protein
VNLERLADVTEDGVDRVLERLEQSDRAENFGSTQIGEVLDGLTVLRAVAGIVEDRLGRELAGVEGGRGGYDLEGRARRIETLRGPVD